MIRSLRSSTSHGGTEASYLALYPSLLEASSEEPAQVIITEALRAEGTNKGFDQSGDGQGRNTYASVRLSKLYVTSSSHRAVSNLSCEAWKHGGMVLPRRSRCRPVRLYIHYCG